MCTAIVHVEPRPTIGRHQGSVKLTHLRVDAHAESRGTVGPTLLHALTRVPVTVGTTRLARKQPPQRSSNAETGVKFRLV